MRKQLSIEVRVTLVSLAASKFLLAVIVAATLSGCAGQDWSRRDTAMELSFQVMNAIDGYQTARIKHHPGLREADSITVRILGDQPDAKTTTLYFATRGISHYLIARALPAKWRPWFQSPTMLQSTWYVIHNCRNGLPPC